MCHVLKRAKGQYAVVSVKTSSIYWLHNGHFIRCYWAEMFLYFYKPALNKLIIYILPARQACMILQRVWFAQRSLSSLSDTGCTWSQTLHMFMKEPVHWEIMPGLCFPLHLAHRSSVCSHLAHHLTQMKTSKWHVQCEVIVFFFLFCFLLSHIFFFCFILCTLSER